MLKEHLVDFVSRRVQIFPVQGGAKIVRDVKETGFRAYQAEDPEGHRWTFAQARPAMV